MKLTDAHYLIVQLTENCPNFAPSKVTKCLYLCLHYIT